MVEGKLRAYKRIAYNIQSFQTMRTGTRTIIFLRCFDRLSLFTMCLCCLFLHACSLFFMSIVGKECITSGRRSLLEKFYRRNNGASIITDMAASENHDRSVQRKGPDAMVPEDYSNHICYVAHDRVCVRFAEKEGLH